LKANISQKTEKAVILRALRSSEKWPYWVSEFDLSAVQSVGSFFIIKVLKIWLIECPTLPLPSLKIRVNG